MGGAGRALASWVTLGMEVQTHLLEVIRKETPLRFCSVRERGRHSQVLSQRKGKKEDESGPIGQQQTEYRHASLWCQASNKGRVVGSLGLGRNQSCQQALLHQSPLLLAEGPLPRQCPNEKLTLSSFLTFFFSSCIPNSLHFAVVLYFII